MYIAAIFRTVSIVVNYGSKFVIFSVSYCWLWSIIAVIAAAADFAAAVVNNPVAPEHTPVWQCLSPD